MTLKELAKELDVSISTVSKALKDNEEISLETRRRIQAFAKHLNYKPNSIALSLRNRSTKSIAVIIPQIVNHFFSKVIKGIEEEAAERGYSTLIAVSNNSFEKEVLHMQSLANGSIDGFILSVAKETMRKNDYHHFNEILSRQIPIVMFDRTIEKIKCDKVIIDDENAAKSATQKLIDTGCKNIVFITTEDFITIGKHRTQGYIKALEQNDLPVDRELIIRVKDELNLKQIERYIRKRLDAIRKSHQKIDGVIGVNEFYTVFAVNYLKDQQIKIPEEVSAICFSDGDLPKYSFPSITAVTQHGNQIGKAAARLLINRIESTKEIPEVQTQIISSEIVERESTRNS